MKTHLDLYDHFAANRDKLADVEWLTETLQPIVRIKRLKWRGSLRIIQIPSEFARWLVYLAGQQCRSYLEIGTSTGGSFYAVDAYLRCAVPGYERSVGYDRTNKIHNLKQYREVFPTVEFRHQSSHRMDLAGEQFDAAFIDARHVEKWVLQDFAKVRDHARIVGFHDIILQNSTVGLAWSKIRTAGESFDLIDESIPVEARCGIGVVKLRKGA